MLELIDVAGRLTRQDLDRVLIADVIRALDRVERVALRRVLSGVAKRGVDPAFGRAGMASSRMKLRDDGDIRARVERLDGRAHARAARANDQYVVGRIHVQGR